MIGLERPLRWAFSTYAHNFGDCSRAIEVARALKANGHTIYFFCHGGQFVKHIEAAGIEPIILEPLITTEQHDVVMAIDQHRAPLGTPLPFTEAQLIAMVEADLRVLREFQPDAVYAGLSLSTLIAAPHLHLPMIACLPTALCTAFFQKGLASFPNVMEKNVLIRYLLPGGIKRRIINRIMLGDSAKASGVIYNRVRQAYGLPAVYNYPALVKGDLTLLPDLPELSGLAAEDLPPGYQYTGPLFARPDMPMPEAVRRVFSRPGLKIYCAMGSSGTPELLKKVVHILRSNPSYNVVCATTTIIDPEELGAPSANFYAAPFLPALEVNTMADVAVIHGGQGTVQVAVKAGTPVVGIGMQWEQQANLDGLSRAGMGIRLPIYSVSRRSLLDAIEKVISADYRTRAKILQARLQEVDGFQNFVTAMVNYVQHVVTHERSGSGLRENTVF